LLPFLCLPHRQPDGRRRENPGENSMLRTIEPALGRLLRSVRAGDRHLVWNDPRVGGAPATIRLTSPAFADGGSMPIRHAGVGVGGNVSPALDWSGVPAGAAALVLIMQDPDAPLPRPVVHLIATGLAPDSSGVPEGGLAAGQRVAFGRGMLGRMGYAGPRPPRGHGPHRYVFQILALSGRLAAPDKPDLAAVMTALGDMVVARGKLVGIYERT
jgi:Raf kinase inhibitor-like YbhB/YbcL family protein